MMYWVCEICGYFHDEEELPEVCPVCGAPKSKFKEQQGDGLNADSSRKLLGEEDDDIDYFERDLYGDLEE